MPKLFNLARMATSTTGTGTITLGSAIASFLSFASAGVQNGDVVTYAIEDGTNREIGRGIYTASGTTLSRETILASTNGGAKISLSGNAQVFITAAAEDITAKLGAIAVQKFTSSGTYTPNTDLLFAIVEVWGAGGSGAASNTGNPAGGGAGGGYAKKALTATTIGASQTVTIGAGGDARAASSNSNGEDGDSTSFGSLLSATGGGGGATSGAASSGGMGSGGDLNLGGLPGFQFGVAGGSYYTLGGAAAVGGGGGAAYSPGSVPGGGGGGGNSGAGSGAGANGLVIVTEFIK